MSCTCPVPASLSAASSIYKNECALCFRVPNLLELCLSCLESFCPTDLAAHSIKHPSHLQFLRIETTFPEPVEKESSPKQPRLDSITIPTTDSVPEAIQNFTFNCTKCSIEGLTDFDSLTLEMAELCKLAVQCSDASVKAQRSGDAWTEPSAQVCEHSLCITQEPIEKNESKCCAQCNLESNLWMCLTCGALGCGRKQFDGSGGNGHALDHFKSSGHPVAIKLGTILYRGLSLPLEADLYCYACDDAVIDLELPVHLRVLGIDPCTTEKTEKSTNELQLHLNLTHSYSMLDESGSALPSLDGPGRRGMVNLGNSCYIASVLQALRGLGELKCVTANHSYEQCQKDRIASKCLICQLRKLETSIESVDQEAKFLIKPTLLKGLLTAGHAEFSSSRQQDASEFMNFLLEESRSPFNCPVLPHFSFQLAQVLKCEGCEQESISCSSQNALQLSCAEDANRVDLLKGFFASESLERICEQCNHARATKQVHMASLPKHLCIISSRLRLRNWIPEKVDCRLGGMIEDLELSSRPVEVSQFKVNEEMLGELLLMGFEEAQAKAALTACKNVSIEAAMDQMYNQPIQSTLHQIDPNAVEMGVAAGFEREAVLAALESCGGDLESAMNMLLNGSNQKSLDCSCSETKNYKLTGFITHQGTSMHCGHYVAHLLTEEDGWVLFNDEKVAKAKEDDSSFPIEKAYIYIYTQQ